MRVRKVRDERMEARTVMMPELMKEEQRDDDEYSKCIFEGD